MESDAEMSSDCLRFWYARRLHLPHLYQLALRSLSAPASSAPVERVFSHGGIIMKLHRASLGNKALGTCFC
jgi:hypothetical protein